MAVFEFFPVAPAGNGGANTIYAATLGATTSSPVITTGNDMIIRVVSSQATTIRFGTTANLTAATATDIYIPANSVQIFDMGHVNNAICIYSFSASTIVTVNQVVKN